MKKLAVMAAMVLAVPSMAFAAGINSYAAQAQQSQQAQQEAQGQTTQVYSSPQGEVQNSPTTSTNTSISQNYNTRPTAIAPAITNISNGPCGGVGFGVSVGVPGASVGVGGTGIDEQCEKRWNVEVLKSLGHPKLADMYALQIPGVVKAVKLQEEVNPTHDLMMQRAVADMELAKAKVKGDNVPQP